MALILVPAILAIIFGLLVIIFPGFLRWLVGIYFILTGVLMLLLQ